MRVGDTIIARGSPPGRSPRALIRLSGPEAHAAIDELAVRHDAPHAAGRPAGPPSVVATALLRTAPAIALPVLLTRFFAPRSATGEDIAEILLPGNPTLVDRLVDLLIGTAPDRLRRAEPGEFTARAFMNGRLDLVQAEGVARLIAARSEDERASAQRLVSGAQGSRLAAWSERLATLLALTEAGIDFSDQEDVVAIPPRDLHARISALERELLGALGPGAAEARQARPRVALVGPPNAGKSTLFNALLGRRRAVVSDTPGSTRDVLVEPLDLSADVPGGPEVDLCDLAGLAEPDLGQRDTRVEHPRPEQGAAAPIASAPQLAQRAARAAIADADVLVICEPRGRFDDVEAALALGGNRKPTLRVRTKADVPLAPHAESANTPSPGEGRAVGSRRSAPDAPAHPEASPAPDTPALSVCALDGWHVPALRRAIADAAMEATGSGGDAIPRHRAAITLASQGLERARTRIDPARRALPDPELVAACLRDALDALGQITGRTTPDDILGRVFASFCVGK